MKKFLTILSAGLLALASVSCVREEVAVFDESKVTPPVLLTSSVDTETSEITATFTPAVSSQNFNEKIAPSHSFAIVVYEGSAASRTVVSKKVDETTISVTQKTISKSLGALGAKDGDIVSFELAIRASIQAPSQDNGKNGYVDSEEHIQVKDYLVVLPEGSPYEEYTKDSDWSLIGAMDAYGIDWDGDLNMWAMEDGKHHVAAHVTLKKGDEVKFRKDQKWDVNMGGEMSSVGATFGVSQDGANIVIGADGVYDLFLDLETETATVEEAYDPYPDYTKASAWGVTGALSVYKISWDGDIAMACDEKEETHAAFGVSLGKEDEFKFRKDAEWTENFGGTYVALDAEFDAVADGDNIKIGAEGVFDLFLNVKDNKITVSEACGLKISAKIVVAAEETPVQVTGWNIIGLNGDWENDVLATGKDGVWTAYITAEEATEFKWRKDGGWEENYGIGADVSYTYGTAFAAVAGGGDIPVSAGFYKVELNLKDSDNPTITVYDDFVVWSLIGDFNSWEGDVDMEEVDGVWVAEGVSLKGGWKVRKNHNWTENRGGTFAELGTAFTAAPGGDNINCGEGEFNVYYDPSAETIMVENALPSNTWSLIGVNGDWDNDIFMTELMPGVWVSPMTEITSAGWKVRFNHGWDVNRGGALNEQGEFAKAVPGGADINLTGTFKVIYNANNETIGTLLWGVVGSVASIDGFSWNNDVPMNLASDGKWYSIPVALTTSDEIKIRQNAAWTVDRGGACTEADAAFEVAQGGSNIKAPADGTYMVVYDPTAETITLSTKFWGLIGAFNDWGGDKFMLFDGTKWVAYNQLLSGAWKIRQASSWDVNRGGVFSAADTAFDAVDGGADITVSLTDPYDVVYDPAAEVIFVGDAANYTAAAPSGITIDGDFSDWAEIDGLSSEDGVYRSFKAVSDGTYLYFYSKRTWNDGLWKDSSGGYFYYELDTDNDETTGTNDVNGNTGYGIETWMYLYLFTGSSSAPTFASSPKGSAYPSSDVIANVTAAGATDGTLIETEVRVPIADVGVKKGDTVRIYTWGNKSASNFKSNKESVLVTVE